MWCDDVETAYVMSAIRFCRLTHSVSKAAFSSIVCDCLVFADDSRTLKGRSDVR